jgi:hypothetical protein
MRKLLVTALLFGVCLGFGVGRLWTPSAAGAAGARSNPAVPARFIGTWQTHGGLLTIFGNGSGVEHLRTYVFCTTTQLTACDRIVKSTIYAGGYENFHITGVQGNVATAGISDSAFSWEVGTKIRITLGKNDTITAHLPGGNVRFCGAQAEAAGTCGA